MYYCSLKNATKRGGLIASRVSRQNRQDVCNLKSLQGVLQLLIFNAMHPL